MRGQTLIILSASIAALGLLAFAPASMAEKPRDEEQPFKQTNIHFETNASACDMGIQMSFDTDGITEAEVENPYGDVVFSMRSVYGMEETFDVTEMFQERVEPPISDLIDELGCEDVEDEAVMLSDLLAAWPEGWYEFDGESRGEEFEGEARLTHRIPAGPEILAPEDGDIVDDDKHLRIRWRKVRRPLVSYLGPIEIAGYHIVVVDVTDPTLEPGATKYGIEADVPAGENSFLVPKQFIEPGRIYEFEVLATEVFGNETITEGGVFCTPPVTDDACEAP
jgi:hypothetical protein